MLFYSRSHLGSSRVNKAKIRTLLEFNSDSVRRPDKSVSTLLVKLWLMKKSLQTLVFWPYWCKERHPTFNEICGHCLLPDGVQMKRWGTNNGIAHLCVSLVFMRYDVIKSIFMRFFKYSLWNFNICSARKQFTVPVRVGNIHRAQTQIHHTCFSSIFSINMVNAKKYLLSWRGGPFPHWPGCHCPMTNGSEQPWHRA